jgi:hypothetical protein
MFKKPTNTGFVPPKVIEREQSNYKYIPKPSNPFQKLYPPVSRNSKIKM